MYAAQHKIVSATFDAAELVMRNRGDTEFEPFESVVFFWFQVQNTSRGINPTPEFVAAAVTEKLERDLKLPKGFIECRLVEARDWKGTIERAARREQS